MILVCINKISHEGWDVMKPNQPIYIFICDLVNKKELPK